MVFQIAWCRSLSVGQAGAGVDGREEPSENSPVAAAVRRPGGVDDGTGQWVRGAGESDAIAAAQA